MTGFESVFNKLWKHFGYGSRPSIPPEADLETTLFLGRRRMLERMMERLIPLAAQRIGMAQTDLQPHFTGITVSQEVRLNAEIRFCGEASKDFHITVNDGLFQFFHHMAKIWASRSTFTGMPIERPRSNITFEETTAVAQNLMKAFWEGRTLLGVQSIPMTSLSRTHCDFVVTLNFYQHSFVLAHELGHTVARFSRGSENDVLTYCRELGTFLSRQNSLAVPPEVLQRWADEFHADLVGTHLCATLPIRDMVPIASNEDDKVVGMSVFLAVALVFVMQDMLEEYYKKTRGDKAPVCGHPPSRLRLTALCGHVECHPDVLQVVKGFQEMAERMVVQI